MSKAETLRIYRTAEEVEPGEDNTFVINDAITQYELEDVRGLASKLVYYDFDNIGGIPLGKILLPNFYIPQEDGEIRLVHLALAARSLAKRIDDDSVEKIVTHDLPVQHKAVVADVAESRGIRFNEPDISSSTSLAEYLLFTATLLPVFLDQCLSVVLGLVWKVPSTADVAYVPSVGRFGSIKPLLDADDRDFQVIGTPLTIAWLQHRYGEFASINQYDSTPIHMFVTLRTLFSELRFIFLILFVEVVYNRRLEQQIRDAIEPEVGISLSRTVEYSVHNVYSGESLRDILYYFSATDAFAQLNCNKVVFGSNSPLGRAMMAASAECGCDGYLVPHSMTYGATFPALFGVEELLPSDADENFFEQDAHTIDTSNTRVTGRPYFMKSNTDIRISAESSSDEITEEEIESDKRTVRILIATQPFSFREHFIKDVLNGVQQMPCETELIIKTHPIESPTFYKNLLPTEVQVKTENLNEELRAADLTITMVSNVGLESMLQGTPSVCLNYWDPLIPSPAWIHYSPVPYLTSKDEAQSFFISCDNRQVDKMWEEQQPFIKSFYRGQRGAVERTLAATK